MTDNAAITFWCAPGNPPPSHQQCKGFWEHTDGRSGACLCRCHPGFTADQVADLMEAGHDYCPRCRSEWDEHDFGDDTVACPRRAR